jgi:hypothetical protein
MAKPTAPLLSFGASGQIGETLVYGTWRGRKYARRYLIPSNPQTAEQQLTRGVFSFLQAAWKTAPPLVQAPSERYIFGKPLTARNRWTQQNLSALRGETDLNNMVMSAGAFGGLPPTAVVATPGTGDITVAITAPSVLPTGWTIQAAVAACIPDGDPETSTLTTIVAGEDLTSTYSIVLAGLDTVLYQVRGWLRWVRPDGSIAYSPDLADTATPS